MNDFRTIKQLRQEGEVDAAAKLSRTLLSQNPQDLWLKRNHAWSIYYLIKKHIKGREFPQAKELLAEFDALCIPVEDELIHRQVGYFRNALDEIQIQVSQLQQEGQYTQALQLLLDAGSKDPKTWGWAVYYFLRQLNKSREGMSSPLLERTLSQLLDTADIPRELPFKLILQELIKLPEQLWGRQSAASLFEHLGGYGQLQEEDYIPFKMDNGKTIMSLAERLHIFYSKALIRESSQQHADKIRKYLVSIELPRMEADPTMLYVPYFKAKLLLASGEGKKGLEAFIPFARKKRREFWVWQVFAEFHDRDPNLYLACLCRALCCGAKEEFLCGIKERLVVRLVEEKQYQWASYELKTLLEVRERNKWGLRSHHRELLQCSWHQQPDSTFKPDYQKFARQADTLLWNGGQQPKVQQHEILIVEVNPTKKIVYFVMEGKKAGFGRFSPLPIPGECRLMTGIDHGNDHWLIKGVQPATPSPMLARYLKACAGKLSIPRDKDFGFIGEVFVPAGIVRGENLVHGEEINGWAVLCPKPKEKNWGWKLVRLGNPEKSDTFENTERKENAHKK